MEENLKQLLLQDLAARVPYGVMVEQTLYPSNIADKEQGLKNVQANNCVQLYWYEYSNEFVPIHCIKPYLRPMSSMSEEEKDEYDRLVMCNASWVVDDWLNKKMFDYRGLIPMGLALEAPEDMYNIK